MIELDPEASAELVRRAKLELRRRMRALRESLPQTAALARSAKIVERLASLPAYRAARSVALFWPIEGKNEVDLAELDRAARAAQKRVFYPFMDRTDSGFRTGFRSTESPGELAHRGRGFAEPPPDAPEAARGDVDFVVVPALAAAADGHRLGYGAGFYDATLPDVRPPALGAIVVYQFQLLAELPPQPHDVACDLVVTDERIIEVSADRG